jgi:hypothetical protein
MSLCANAPIVIWPTLSSRIGRCRRPPTAVYKPNRIKPVTAQLDTDGAFGMAFEEVTEAPIRQPAARRHPSLRLLELITTLVIVQKVCEIRKQVEAVVQDERVRTKSASGGSALQLGRHALPVCCSVVGSINHTEAGDRAVGDCAVGHLIGRVPSAPITHSQE